MLRRAWELPGCKMLEARFEREMFQVFTCTIWLAFVKIVKHQFWWSEAERSWSTFWEENNGELQYLVTSLPSSGSLCAPFATVAVTMVLLTAARYETSQNYRTYGTDPKYAATSIKETFGSPDGPDHALKSSKKCIPISVRNFVLVEIFWYHLVVFYLKKIVPFDVLISADSNMSRTMSCHLGWPIPWAEWCTSRPQMSSRLRADGLQWPMKFRHCQFRWTISYYIIYDIIVDLLYIFFGYNQVVQHIIL